MSILIHEHQSVYRITADYTPRTLAAIKRIDGAWFDWKNKQWVVSRRQEAAVLKFSQRFGGNVITGNFSEENKTYEIEPMPDLPQELIDVLPLLIKKQPEPFPPYGFPYQHQGIAYNLQHGKVINGDEMGLGKSFETIATLAFLDYLYRQGKGEPVFPAIVICPATLKMNWEIEFKKFSYIKAMIFSDQVKYNFMRFFETGLAQVFITNYESLDKYLVHKISIPKGKKLALEHITFKPVVSEIKAVVLDESHRVRNIQTKICKLSKGIADGKKFIFALTGTAVVNTPKDLISQLGIINQFWRFIPIEVIEKIRHSGDRNAGKSWFEARYTAGPRRASNLKELNKLLTQHCFFRRAKKDVIKEMPAKIRQVVYCQIDNRDEYNVAVNDLETYLVQYRNATDEQVMKSMRGEIMVRIGILKNISARGKINDVSSYIEDMMESGVKFGLFAHQHIVVDALKERFPGTLCITGRETIIERQAAVESFQNNPDTKLIFLGIQAAGVGITLTAGSRCGFVELGWHPAIHDQCEDRFHRIGQLDSVNCAYFIGKGTIDEDIYKLIEDKRVMMNTVIGAEDTVERETKIMDELISILSKKKIVHEPVNQN